MAGTIQDSALEHNSIYAALFTHDPGSSWHWAIYLHHEIQASERHDAASGHKFHATNKYGPWQYECVATDILHDQELTVLAKIGAIEDEDWGAEFLEQYLIPIPMEVPEVDHRQERVFTCRVWFREAIRVFHEAEVFIECPDVDGLERELSSQARLVDAKTSRFSDEPVSVLIVSKKAHPTEESSD